MIISSSAEELLVRIGSRDPYAFEELYDLLHGPVLKYVNRVVRDWAQSEEIVQEVFLEVWRSAARFAPARGSARTWVLRIAHFRAVDRIRLENNRRSREASVSSDSSITYDSVQELVEVRCRRSEAERFLDLLTELQRDAVILVYYLGCTLPEAASLLDVPLSTAKSRVFDGLTSMRSAAGVAPGRRGRSGVCPC